LKKGGVEPIACEARAHKNLSHAPKTLTTPLINALVSDREGCFRPSVDEKLLFRERILESSKFIVGLSYQLLIISNNSCYSATELAVVPDLRGVLQPHSPSLDTPLHSTNHIRCGVDGILNFST
jgi:hypothetical protein